MKMCISNRFLLPVLITSLGFVLPGWVAAQTFTTLYSFNPTEDNGTGYFTNSDGQYPKGLVLVGATLYGSAENGGISGNGTLFRINSDGTGFMTVHSFSCTDGRDPASPILGDFVYGTTYSGGISGEGTIFRMKGDGSEFTTLHSFSPILDPFYTNSDGANPQGALILSSGTLYGTTYAGGASGAGTVFTVDTNGLNFSVLHNFTRADSSGRNSDGMEPHCGLALSNNVLYGTALYGGASGGGSLFSGGGTVFSVNTDGTGFRTLHTFSTLNSNGANSDGANPSCDLALAGNTLYGMTQNGGALGSGTIFKINTDGTSFTTLYNFTGLIGETNRDGADPGFGRLILLGSTLYGTAPFGGTSGNGTVFKLTIDGSNFTNLHSFTAISPPYTGTNADGSRPSGFLVLSGNNLYGTTRQGGDGGSGTVFSISLSVASPPLAIVRDAADVILKWPTSATGFTLQSTTNLVSGAMWTTVSPAPVILNNQYTVTNPISGTRKFYRLIQ